MRSNLQAEITIGIGDGLVVPFVLGAALSGAQVSCSLIGLVGLIAVLTGAVIMGYTGYHAAKKDLSAGNEKTETREFLAGLGLSEEMQDRALAELANDKEEWDRFLASKGIDINVPSTNYPPARSGFYIGVAYAIGGLLSIAPYFFVVTPTNGFIVSAAVTLTALLIAGYSKGRLTGANPWWAAARACIIGAIAGAAAFTVARTAG